MYKYVHVGILLLLKPIPVRVALRIIVENHLICCVYDIVIAQLVHIITIVVHIMKHSTGLLYLHTEGKVCVKTHSV